VKESWAENRDLHICIPTNEAGNITGLKTKWWNVVKDIAYCILDLRIRHWDEHPQHQKKIYIFERSLDVDLTKMERTLVDPW
jgi:hypothetical protein